MGIRIRIRIIEFQVHASYSSSLFAAGAVRLSFRLLCGEAVEESTGSVIDFLVIGGLCSMIYLRYGLCVVEKVFWGRRGQATVYMVQTLHIGQRFSLTMPCSNSFLL